MAPPPYLALALFALACCVVVVLMANGSQIDLRVESKPEVAAMQGIGVELVPSALSKEASSSDTAPPSVEKPPLRPIRINIAYCINDDRKKTTLPTPSEFIARTYGPYMFPRPYYHVSYNPVYMWPQDLPAGLDPASEAGLQLLGIDEATHVRFCERGASALVHLIKSRLPSFKVAHVSNATVVQRLLKAKLWDSRDREGWMYNRMLRWPDGSDLRVLTDRTTKLVRLPMMFRNTQEPLYESVPGVSGTLDCKRDFSSVDSATVYFPYIVYSTIFRLPSYQNSSTAYMYAPLHPISSFADAYTRSRNFNATHERVSKKYFASFVQQHCAGYQDIYPCTLIRELITFTLHHRARRPINHLGNCPWGNVTVLGLSQSEHKAVYREHQGQPVAKIHSKHKFALSMENAAVDGYITEKIASGYLGRSVPVYFGSPQSTDVLNPQAYIACVLPSEFSDLGTVSGSEKFKKELCKSIRSRPHQCENGNTTCVNLHSSLLEQECYGQFAAKYKTLLEPFLNQCADKVLAIDLDDAKYEAMLREPLVPVDPTSGEPAGVWSPAVVGKAMFAAFVGSGYLEATLASDAALNG